MLDKRRSASQSVAWFLDLFHSKQLDLDPEYQRRSVWNEDYKKYFIDTVFRNFPSPAIFLDVEISPSGRSVYHVVDGKQRLTSIIDYVKDKFKSSEQYSDPELGGKYYSELPDPIKTKFLRYILPVEFLDGADDTDLQQAFDRLNRNVARLNAQELRHARFSGEFITLMENLADDPFWKVVGVATPARIRRMQDVEFVSDIFAGIMRGLDRDIDLEEVYAEYDQEIPELEHVRAEYEATKARVMELFPKFQTVRFKNMADLFSLWFACLASIREGKNVDADATAKALSDFVEAARNEETTDQEAKRYLVAVSQGSNKAANRKVRADLLFSRFVWAN